jgi:hypothetical protein
MKKERRCESECSPAAATAPASTRSSVRSSARGSAPTATRSSASSTAGAGSSRTTTPRRRAAARHAAPGRHHPRHVAHHPYMVDDGSTGPGHPRGQRDRRAHRHRRRGHPVGVACRLQGGLVRSSACPRPSTTTSAATEMTFGFHTAVQIATDAIDRLHTTAESHDRVMVVEVMGRHAGHIATWAGIAGGATDDPHPRGALRHRGGVRAHDPAPRRGRYASIVVVAEGAQPKEGTLDLAEPGEVDEFGHQRLGGIAPSSPRRSRSGPASRPGSRSWATCSGAAPRRLRPGPVHPVRHRRHRRRPRRCLRQMVALRATRSCGCRWPTPWAS